MFIVPIILLVILLGIVIVANQRKKEGAMTETAYQKLVSLASVIVTVAALVVMFMRLRG
jgi:heme/copper-type cytochrome/quinol oxidase subunit 2